MGFIVLGNNVHNSKFQKSWDFRGNHTEMGKIMLKNRVLPYIFAAREFPGHSFFPISAPEVNLSKYVVVSRF